MHSKFYLVGKSRKQWNQNWLNKSNATTKGDRAMGFSDALAKLRFIHELNNKAPFTVEERVNLNKGPR